MMPPYYLAVLLKRFSFIHRLSGDLWACFQSGSWLRSEKHQLSETLLFPIPAELYVGWSCLLKVAGLRQRHDKSPVIPCIGREKAERRVVPPEGFLILGLSQGSTYLAFYFLSPFAYSPVNNWRASLLPSQWLSHLLFRTFPRMPLARKWQGVAEVCWGRGAEKNILAKGKSVLRVKAEVTSLQEAAPPASFLISPFLPNRPDHSQGLYINGRSWMGNLGQRGAVGSPSLGSPENRVRVERDLQRLYTLALGQYCVKGKVSILGEVSLLEVIHLYIS